MDAVWTTRSELEAKGEPLAKKFGSVLENLDFDSLSTRALLVRHIHVSNLPIELSCHVNRERFAFGRCNILFVLKFSDGVQWVARISCSERDKAEDEVRQEVMIMNFVREQTTIPIPAIHDHNSSLIRENSIGYRYILMDFVKGGQLGFKAIPVEHHANFVRQFADYFYQLSTLRFSGIAPIELNERIEYCAVKQRQSCQTSSWNNSLLFLHEQRSRINRDACDPAWNSIKQSLAAACQFLMQAVPLAIETDYMNGPFPMTHMDMHQNNIMVDKSFNITGIIDWSNAQPLPMEVFACHPMFVGGVGLSDEQNAPTIKLRTDIAREFHQLAKEAQDGLGMRIADLIGSAKSELANYLLFSPPRLVMADAKIRVLKLLHGKEAKWNDVEKLIVNGPYFKQTSQLQGCQQGDTVTQREQQNAQSMSVLGKRARE